MPKPIIAILFPVALALASRAEDWPQWRGSGRDGVWHETGTLLHVIPSLAAFVATGYIGRWVDRTNPWPAWGWVRLGCGLDPILLSVVPLPALTISSGAIALHAFWEARREKPDPRLATISNFESQFKHTSGAGGGCN